MTSASSPRLDIVIPVYNEGANILQTLGSLLRSVGTSYRLVLVLTADDDYNAKIIDDMVVKALTGFDIVCPSRFAPGGTMTGCPFFKAFVTVVGNVSLHYLARLPTADATNGFRLFSRRVLDQIAIESHRGFCYSIELLVKCHRLGWPIAEVAAQWHERVRGTSRFRVIQWLPAYARWYLYALATTYLRRSPRTVRLKQATSS